MHVMGSVSPANQVGFSAQEDVAAAEAMSPPSALGFSHPTKNGKSLLDNRAPPPPAPLPPPPPPPPLLPTGLGGSQGVQKKKKRVRSFFWKTIPAEQVKGYANLWTQDQVRQCFQIDVQKIEELFTQCDGPPAATPFNGGKARVSFRNLKDEVSILDSKRGLNIAIFLKQFKRSNQMLVDDIRHGNSGSFGAEPLRELLKLLPEKEEVKKLKGYRGDASKLSLADSFVHLLTQLPSFLVSIESMLLKEEFPGAVEAMRQDFKIVRSATTELMYCKELHAVLHLVLQAGNILNAGGSAGDAVGFKLSSLLSLADTKSNKPGMNLLHFVALEAQKKDQKLLEFPLKLSNIQAASRISMETLDAELQTLTSRTRSVEESIQKDTELLQQLDSFLQDATSTLCSLRGCRQQLKRDGSELIDFFCEDRETFRLDDCFSIFHTFCTRFTNAAKENKEREAKEAARRQRMQEEELKRHSWSGGEEVTGAIGWRCRSETDMSAAASIDEAGLLLDLLNPRPQPRSPLITNHIYRGRSGSLLRSRNSPSSSPSLAAERELSALLEKSNDLRVPRHRGNEDTRKHLPPGSSKLEPPGATKLSASVQLVSQIHQESSSDRNPENVQKDVNPLDNVPAMSTSESNQEKLSKNPNESCLGNKTADQSVERSTTAAKGSMSVLLDKCTLVPELKAFDGNIRPFGDGEVRCTDNRHDDTLTTGLEEGRGEKAQNNFEEVEKEDVEDEEVKVIVWCVTGVCEGGGENSHQHIEDVKTWGENQQTSSATTNHECSEAQADGEVTESLPISSQPVSVSRYSDSALPVSSPGPHPVEPAATPADVVSASPDPSLTAEAVRKDKQPANPVAKLENSTNHNGSISKKTLMQRTVEGSSAGGKTKQETSTKNSTKKFSNSRTGSTGMKPSSTTSAGGRSIRTLTPSENHSMRRVVPITRTIPGSSPRDKKPEKPPTHSWSPSRTRTPGQTGLNVSNSSSTRRGLRPGTAPPSQRSGTTKTPESKELQEQNQDLQGRRSVKKPVMKPRTQTEEKMCLSELRALGQVGGGGSASAPVTPLHKTRTASSSVLPGFTRNTASSSFRRTKPALAASHPPNAGTPDSSPKTSSSSPAPPSSKSTRPNPSSSSPARRSHSTRASASSPLHGSLAPPKGHRRNDSGSDKSTHSKDWSKSSRPSWR